MLYIICVLETDKENAVVLALFDLRSAFHMVHHDILIFEVMGAVLKWFSFLTNLSQQTLFDICSTDRRKQTEITKLDYSKRKYHCVLQCIYLKFTLCIFILYRSSWKYVSQVLTDNVSLPSIHWKSQGCSATLFLSDHLSLINMTMVIHLNIGIVYVQHYYTKDSVIYPIILFTS